jgi:hypothetical protein
MGHDASGTEDTSSYNFRLAVKRVTRVGTRSKEGNGTDYPVPCTSPLLRATVKYDKFKFWSHKKDSHMDGMSWRGRQSHEAAVWQSTQQARLCFLSSWQHSTLHHRDFMQWMRKTQQTQRNLQNTWNSILPVSLRPLLTRNASGNIATNWPGS